MDILKGLTRPNTKKKPGNAGGKPDSMLNLKRNGLVIPRQKRRPSNLKETV
jgi:hypothetical protein